ncbi:dihydrofolate reductase family protein [Nocardia arthritidis]|uniref:Bacterial bifunctional deaminase-reductase C-terminal domain-containing protein n=1 Tax=Nocardia arthritidis TaxID=228602 RepID=A0A6G9Y476_9NOCA|nr:dihydrofolate reductase family protein [Nocardia arthritidis]QIS08009.1 hypothetical protein F5544_00380 [Nocardia arthritidis]
MRKLVALEHMTVDGYVDSGEGMGFEWTFPGMSEEVSAFAGHVIGDVDTAMYGRKTYLGMYGHWSAVPDNPDAGASDLAHADWVNNVAKVVASTTLESADWHNSRLISTDLTAAVQDLKSADGETIMIFASPVLVHSLAAADLIDEYRVFVHPVVIGGGTPLFAPKSNLGPTLAESNIFDNGVVYLRYAVA